MQDSGECPHDDRLFHTPQEHDRLYQFHRQFQVPLTQFHPNEFRAAARFLLEYDSDFFHTV